MERIVMDRAGWPFVAGAAAPAVVVWWLGWPWLAVVFAGLTAFMAFFFRDPHRAVPTDASLVVSPADGRVLIAGAADPEAAPSGDWTQVSIFLSPLNVHINRIPIGGVVTKVEHVSGQYYAAYRPEAPTKNERNEVWIERDGRTVVCRQVVGVLARRLVCRVTKGTTVQAGERYGLMKFGSRIDLFLPVSVTLEVSAGDTVRGGETVLARWT
jgi:phosphatidylserine decarboxylase